QLGLGNFRPGPRHVAGLDQIDDPAASSFAGTVDRSIWRSLLQGLKRRHAELAFGLVDVALSALGDQNRGNVLCEAEVLRRQRAARGRRRISLGFLSRSVSLFPFLGGRRESGDEANDSRAAYKMQPGMNTMSKVSLLHSGRAPRGGRPIRPATNINTF